MIYSDIHEFCDDLEHKGDLQRIGVEVDSDLEIAAIVNRVNKQCSINKALIFERVKGSKYPLAINLFGSKARMAMALGSNDVAEIARRLSDDLSRRIESTDGKANTFWQWINQPVFSPKIISSAVCQDRTATGNPDLTEIPALRCWPEEGGRFFTLPQVYTRDPETGVVNCGMYRIQVHSKNSAGIHWGPFSDGAKHYRKNSAQGLRTPVTIVLGGDPALLYTASAPIPSGVDEVRFAAYLRQQPVQMTPCQTNDLMAPVGADWILEGYVEPGREMLEGPFGNHTGYYDTTKPVPLFSVERITQRVQPLYPCTLVGPPPMEDCFMAKASEIIFLPLVQQDHPEVKTLYQPMETIFHPCTFVGIRERECGKGRQVIRQLWEGNWFKRAKLLVVVDENTPLNDTSTLFWRVINRARFDKDVIIDGGRMGIDATGIQNDDTDSTERRRQMVSDPTIEKIVDRRWKEYGF